VLQKECLAALHLEFLTAEHALDGVVSFVIRVDGVLPELLRKGQRYQNAARVAGT
jgi:hypothetical protein